MKDNDKIIKEYMELIEILSINTNIVDEAIKIVSFATSIVKNNASHQTCLDKTANNFVKVLDETYNGFIDFRTHTTKLKEHYKNNIPLCIKLAKSDPEEISLANLSMKKRFIEEQIIRLQDIGSKIKPLEIVLEINLKRLNDKILDHESAKMAKCLLELIETIKAILKQDVSFLSTQENTPSKNDISCEGNIEINDVLNAPKTFNNDRFNKVSNEKK